MKFGDYLKERFDMDFLINNVTGKKYKGMEITNSVYDDDKGTMIKFWVKDPKTKKIKEIRPIPKDELIKVLK
jgi:hypothetical protein